METSGGVARKTSVIPASRTASPVQGMDGRSFMVPNRRVVARVVAVLQENRFDMRVMLQNSNEFRPAIPAMSDDADLRCQVIEYSSL
jgi:hypothetical protein